MYFRGQGKVYIFTRDSATGKPVKGRWVGNCPELKLGLNVDNIEHKESHSGQSLTDLKIPKGKSTSLSFTLEDFNKENLSLALYGTSLAVAAGSAIVDEVLGNAGATTIAVGDVFTLAKRNASAFVLKDSTGTPKTLTVDVNYTLEPNSGTITIIDSTTGGPFVGPLKASYTPGANTEIAMFNTPQSDVFLRFVGMNQADSGKIVTCDLYKVNISPTKELNLITEELAQLVLEGAALMDTTKPANATLGQFGAIYQQS